jgi:hypothetical protein
MDTKMWIIIGVIAALLVAVGAFLFIGDAGDEPADDTTVSDTVDADGDLDESVDDEGDDAADGPEGDGDLDTSITGDDVPDGGGWFQALDTALEAVAGEGVSSMFLYMMTGYDATPAGDATQWIVEVGDNDSDKQVPGEVGEGGELVQIVPATGGDWGEMERVPPFEVQNPWTAIQHVKICPTVSNAVANLAWYPDAYDGDGAWVWELTFDDESCTPGQMQTFWVDAETGEVLDEEDVFGDPDD